MNEEDKIKNEWENFLDWLYEAHSITKDYIPNKTSIELWEEYKKAKKEKVKWVKY